MASPLLVSACGSAAALPSDLPSMRRASEMASCRSEALSSGHALLDAELPDGGWPAGVLIELLAQQHGIGEMRLLQPALRLATQSRRIALVQPPHSPQAAAWATQGLPLERLLWLKPARAADALWAAEQILRNGACGALLFWQAQVRHESLRRLHLAAQAANVVFWMIRPLADARDASPAPLRLALRPAVAGISIEIVKRRGPRRDTPILLPLAQAPTASPAFSEFAHALVDRRASSTSAARSLSSALV